MKYIFISLAALALVFGLCFLVTGLIRRKMTKKIHMALHILLSILSGVLAITVVAAVYLNIHYSADDKALSMVNRTQTPSVSDIGGAYFIDGEGTDTAMIFYQGAKVDAEAYLPLMCRLAEDGTDCFLVKAPFRIAIFGSAEAEKIINGYSYQHWLISGHSMGGIAAATVAQKHPDTFDGVILLASYPTVKLDSSTALLSVYGSEDRVIQRDAYEDSKPLFPENSAEFVIDGGNHSGFGNYGAQSGDGEASISSDEQQKQTAEKITEFEAKYLK